MCYLSYIVSGSLTEEEILRMDNQVRKNRKNLRYGLVSAVVAIQFVAPSIGVIVPLPPTQIERQINQPSEKTEGAKKVLDDEVEKGNQEEFCLNLRGGGKDITEFILRILLIWAMSKNHQPTEGFQPIRPNPTNQYNLGTRQVQPNPRIAPKLQAHPNNPINRNNLGTGSSKFSKHPSMEEVANKLTPAISK